MSGFDSPILGAIGIVYMYVILTLVFRLAFTFIQDLDIYVKSTRSEQISVNLTFTVVYMFYMIASFQMFMKQINKWREGRKIKMIDDLAIGDEKK